MLPGASHQRRPPKHDDAEAAPGEKLDEPASKYARIQWFVVLWLVFDNVLLTFGSLGKKGSRAVFFHAEMLVYPISISLLMLYIFGTLDSLAVGTRAICIWVGFWVYQAVFSAAAMWARGHPFLDGLSMFIFFLFTATAFGWLIRILREELRALSGSLDETTSRITTRLLEIMGFQAALMIRVHARNRKKCIRTRCDDFILRSVIDNDMALLAGNHRCRGAGPCCSGDAVAT